MKTFRIASTLLFLLCASRLPAQNPAAAKGSTPVASREPLIVDVHASPYRPSITYSINISPQRFDMRNATILNLIDFANGKPDDDGREDATIIGGPTWIDLDRFDVAALIPSLKPITPDINAADSANSYELTRTAIRRVLEERFHLKYHTSDRPLPGYLATVAKDGPKLAEAKDPTAPSRCQFMQTKAEEITIACTSETVARLFESIGGPFRHPVIDHTGLTKSYDFSVKLSSEQTQTREDAIHAYIDAFNKQLGIVLTPGDVPQQAVVIDSVERPTPNPPEIAKQIPALPDLEFEVASIRPVADEGPQRQIRPTGSQITFVSFSLQDLLTRAWQLPTGAMLGSALPLLPRTRYTIIVKLPPGIDGRTVYQDRDQIDSMLQKLLIDRFQVKYHWGEWTQPDAYVLLGGTPKMKKADPNSRSYCKYGPAEGEKDVRTHGSPFDAEFHCQNVTMAQFADLTQAVASSEIKNRVPDKTGLTGSYDFTVFYTTGRTLRTQIAGSKDAARPADDATPAPVSGMDVQEAFHKQLGLRLERQPLTLPALVLDHFAPTPTEN